MDSADAEGRVSLLAAAPIVVLVEEIDHASVHTLQEGVNIAHHLTSLCALGVCAQTACCCSSLRSARPRRSWKLQSIALEYALPRDASCASHMRRCSPRRVYSSWCTAVVVAPWPTWSGCVMLVSVRRWAAISVFWPVMVPVKHVGPFATAVERLGTFYYTRTQKREILESPGLQHVSHAVSRSAPGVFRSVDGTGRRPSVGRSRA